MRAGCGAHCRRARARFIRRSPGARRGAGGATCPWRRRRAHSCTRAAREAPECCTAVRWRRRLAAGAARRDFRTRTRRTGAVAGPPARPHAAHRPPQHRAPTGRRRRQPHDGPAARQAPGYACADSARARAPRAAHGPGRAVGGWGARPHRVFPCGGCAHPAQATHPGAGRDWRARSGAGRILAPNAAACVGRPWRAEDGEAFRNGHPPRRH